LHEDKEHSPCQTTPPVLASYKSFDINEKAMG
jgi:hypothetical protein